MCKQRQAAYNASSQEQLDITDFKLHLITYHHKDVLHRSDGPAIISIDKKINNYQCAYLINGFFIREEEYLKTIDEIKNDKFTIVTTNIGLLDGYKIIADFYNKNELVNELIQSEVLIKLMED